MRTPRTAHTAFAAVALSILLVAALALSGCSGSGDSSTASSAGTSTETSAGAPPSGSPPPGGAPGMPPGGSAGAPPGGAPGGGSQTPQYTPTGAYTLTSGTASKPGAISARANDQSGVLVTGGTLTLSNATITTSGDSSSPDESSFYGLNAGVLATAGAITITGGSVKTIGAGANGVFAYGDGTTIAVSGTTIKASGEYAHGIMASGGGVITADGLTVNTTGGSSAPVATDRGGGTITVTGGTYTCSGNNSPGIYSTGTITATGATFSSTGSEIVVIEGSNSVKLVDTALTTSKAGKWGVMIYQSMSGDAEGGKGAYTMTGGSLTDTAKDSPLFYVTNSTGTINLTGVRITAASGVLVKAAVGNWGTSGSNGGSAVVTCVSQSLAGDLVADSLSSLALTLKNGSSLTGAIDTANTAKAAQLTLDAGSVWKVTADSHLTTLTGATISGSAVTNIVGNGHVVYYAKSASANSALGGKTYTLQGGGTLVPE